MNLPLDPVRDELAARSGDRWEIYAKRAAAAELRVAPPFREESERLEDGCAARWEERTQSYFAAATSPALLVDVIRETSRLGAGASVPLPVLPPGSFPAPPDPAVPSFADAFEVLAQLLASESKGQARLTSLALTSGAIAEQIENGAGFAGGRSRGFGYGNARSVGVAAERRVTADVVFPLSGTGSFDAAKVAQSLADRSLLPLKGKASPYSRGELLLDPSVSAAIVAATLPLFCGDGHRLLLSRRYLDRSGRFSAEGVSLADDPSADGAFDAEGVPARRKEVVADGVFRTRLHDLASSARCGETPTGNAVRPSFRLPPRAGSTLFLLDGRRPSSAAELLSSVTRGIYATALAAPARVDLENDAYRLEVEGWALQAGRVRSPVAAAVIRGRLSELWKGIRGVGTDRRTFPLQSLVAAPTLFIAKATFS